MNTYHKTAKNYNQINFPTPNINRQKLESRDTKKNWRMTRQGKRHQQVVNIEERPQKIEIDSSLLFSRNNAPRTLTQHHKRQTNNLINYNEQDKFYQTSKEGFGLNVERPQSKQQPRSKLLTSVSVKKTPLEASGRPQTSKGIRTTTANNNRQDIGKRKTSVNIQDDIIKIPNKLVRKNNNQHPLSATTRKSDIQGKIKFETSLDPQFLSLFAS